MKKPITFYFAALFLTSCMPATQITGAWKNPRQPTKAYSSIFVASLSSNTVARATVENNIALALEKQGVISYKSMDEFPPGVEKDSLTKDDIVGRMKSKNADAILTVSLIRKETDSRYVPGGGMPYAPLPLFPYYSDFGGYYSFRNPYIYNPGYYEQDQIYYIETNLYDSATEQLTWSAQSRTYNPTDLQNFSMEFSKVIVDKLKADGMLKPSGNIASGK